MYACVCARIHVCACVELNQNHNHGVVLVLAHMEWSEIFTVLSQEILALMAFQNCS